jgi:hypothetical protein
LDWCPVAPVIDWCEAQQQNAWLTKGETIRYAAKNIRTIYELLVRQPEKSSDAAFAERKGHCELDRTATGKFEQGV